MSIRSLAGSNRSGKRTFRSSSRSTIRFDAGAVHVAERSAAERREADRRTPRRCRRRAASAGCPPRGSAPPRSPSPARSARRSRPRRSARALAADERVDASRRPRPSSPVVVVAIEAARRPFGPCAPRRPRARIDSRRRHAGAERLGQARARPCRRRRCPTSSSSVIGPTGKAEVDQRVVDRFDRRALVEQTARLVHVRRQDARRVEARAVVHDDHRLAQLLAVRDRGDRRLRRRLPASRSPRAAASCARARRSACRARARGARAASAMRAIGIVLVFDAKIACGRAAGSTSAAPRA